MAKLQQIIRKDGTAISSVNIPKVALEESMLKKGDVLEVKSNGIGKLVIEKKEGV